jgi:hypothetical protein
MPINLAHFAMQMHPHSMNFYSQLLGDEAFDDLAS